VAANRPAQARVSASRALAARALTSVGWRSVGLADRLRPQGGAQAESRTLHGDRELEWAWCLGQLPEVPGRVLDFGAGNGILAAGAAFRGHDVVAVDLEPCAFHFELDGIEFRQGDFNEMEFQPQSFDHIINCSTTEHVGLPDRYSGSSAEPDADIRAMERLAPLLKPGACMGFTIPVGRDAVFSPLHRVYGSERLPRLLAPFEISTERYWTKPHGPLWHEVDRATALAEHGSQSYYALGLFTLRPAL
jgi:SAM-dependent methyltransferase